MEEPPPGPGGARMPRSLQLCCSTAGFPVPKPRSSLRVDPILFFIAWYIRGESAAAGWRWCTWGSGRIWGREGFRKQGAAGDIPSACSDPPVVGAGGNPEGFGAVLSSGGAVLGVRVGQGCGAVPAQLTPAPSLLRVLPAVAVLRGHPSCPAPQVGAQTPSPKPALPPPAGFLGGLGATAAGEELRRRLRLLLLLLHFDEKP